MKSSNRFYNHYRRKTPGNRLQPFASLLLLVQRHRVRIGQLHVDVRRARNNGLDARLGIEGSELRATALARRLFGSRQIAGLGMKRADGTNVPSKR